MSITPVLRSSLLLVGLLALRWTASAQAAEYVNPPFGVGARMAALAESDVSEARDVSGMYWNPALIGGLDHNTVVATHQWTRDLTNEVAAISFNLSNTDAVAFGGLMTQFPSVAGRPASSHAPVQYGLDIAYAHKFTYAFSVGVRLSGRYGQVDGAPTGLTTGFGNIGLFYSPNPVFSYGAVYNQVGSGLAFRTDGFSQVFQQEHLNGSVELGVVMRYPSTIRNRMLTMSISNEKQIDVHGMNYKFGVEYLPVAFVALRLGYFVEPTMTRPTYGAGLHYEGIAVDYAYAPHKFNYELHQVTLTAAF